MAGRLEPLPPPLDIPETDRELVAVEMRRTRREELAVRAEAYGMTPRYLIDHALELLFLDMDEAED